METSSTCERIEQDLNFSDENIVIPSGEHFSCETAATPKIEVSSNNKDCFDVTGKRIVDIKFFISQLQQLNSHSPFGCGLSDMEIISEIKKGLISGLKFQCKMCNLIKVVWTENLEENLMNSNTAAAAGIIKIGAGFSNMDEFLSTMNIPCMAEKTFNHENENLSRAWETTALNEMNSAAEEERNIALEKGDVGADGIPQITVIVDGCWGKRSYRTNYSSSSGVAAIVGQETGKVLFLGVRNKYCCICSRAATKNIAPAKHTCYKNWSSSSSAMESDILVEGFIASIELNGLVYSRFVGDGDSNFHKKISEARPYDTLTVEKIECTNHLLRNACNRLKDIVKCGKFGCLALRKLLGERILRFRTAVTMAVRFRKSEKNVSEINRVNALKDDILNIPMHVFGSHDHCATYFCSKKEEKNFAEDLKSSEIFVKVMSIMNNLADNSRSLLFKVNNNAVEQFNSIVAKFVGGKRVNFSQRGSYQTRCHAAVVSQNNKTPFRSLHKQMFSRSPGIHAKRSEERRERKRQRTEARRKLVSRKRLFQTKRNNGAYGPCVEKPDLCEQDYLYNEKRFLDELKLNKEEIQEIEEKTRTQHESAIWMAERRNRLTASNFGVVCNKLPTTKCDTIVKKLLYFNLKTDAMKYGKEHEMDAINVLKTYNYNVSPCGLFIDEDLPFLAASPDGLVDKDGIVEIKCPASCQNMTPEEGIFTRKVTFWKADKEKKNILGINTKHIFYFQVQGQLHITKKQFCLFVLWTPKGTKIEKIEKDNEFWKTKMEQKLKNFYFDCLLPEIIDPRFTRSLNLRNPYYIIDAINKKNSNVST